MTDFYKNNDNLLRDKLTQHEFAQSPNAWENMSALLDQHPVVPKRAIGYWWSVPFVTAAALASVIGLGMYLTPTTAQTAPNTNVPIAEQTAKESFVVPNNSNTKQLTSEVVNLTPINKEASTNKVDQQKIVASKALPKKETIVKNNITKRTRVASSTKTKKQPETLVANTVPTTVIEKQPTDVVPTTESTTSNKPANTKRKVKTTRTEIIYQYSTTPLRALQEKRKAMQQQNTIGNFGIGDELDTKKSPLKASVFGGVNAKMVGSTKAFSVMPFAGVSASYRIAKHHGIQTGIQYKSIGNPNSNAANIIHDPSTAMPSAGKEKSIERIDLLEIPLVYQFRPHPNYNFQAGVKGAWLVNTQINDANLNKLSNADLGISDFDFSLLLGMEYCFNENWAMGIQYSLGLVNLTQQASKMHETEVEATRTAGYDPQYNINSLDKKGELIVPASAEDRQTQTIKVPNQLHNTDVQLLLKYTF